MLNYSIFYWWLEYIWIDRNEFNVKRYDDEIKEYCPLEVLVIFEYEFEYKNISNELAVR